MPSKKVHSGYLRLVNSKKGFGPLGKPHEICPVSNKVIWGEKIARKRAVEMTEKYGRKMKPYQCKHCNKWHVGGVELKNRGR